MRLITPLTVLGLLFCGLIELSAQSVRVVFVSGAASVQRPEEPALRPAVKGETIIIGTRIVTGADGRLVLTPMPGIKSIVTPNTTLLLESASENRTSDANVTQKVVLDLKEGSVVSDLQKPEGVTYDYSIRTARGLAGARGTTYTVGINSAGIQTIVVAHGAISINFSDGRKMTLAPGQLSVTKANGQSQKVENLSQLSPEDQKVAQKAAETTIAAIATAIDAGIKVAPEALNNALAAAKDLGVTLSPETQKAVSGALDTSDAPPPEAAPGDAPPPAEAPPPGDAPPPPTGEPASAPAPTGDPLPPPPTGTTEPKPPLLPPPGSTLPPPPPPNITEITAKSPLDLFLARLPATVQGPFLALPGDIQNLLISLNEIDLAVFVLNPDPDTGLAFTQNDLRTHLAAFNGLKQQNLGAFIMVKDMAGPGLVNLDSTPDPLQWSAGAFARTLASWNALTATERALIIDLGAGDAIMDTSTAYIQALLAPLTATDIALIKAAGLGRHLVDLATSPTAQSFLSTIAGLSATELAVVKDFDVSPNSNGSNLLFAIQALAAATVSEADRLIIKQLGVGDRMLNEFGSPPRSNSSIISSTLAFYNSLTPAEQAAARALNLGHIFYEHPAGDTYADTSLTALQRVQQLTGFYLSNPALQQTLEDSRILSFELLPENFLVAETGSTPHDSLVSTLAVYNGLPARTRAYLDIGHDSKINFYELANPLIIGASPSFRPLADINMILNGLTNEQFSTLIDLDLSAAIIGGYDPSGTGPGPSPFYELLNTTDRVADLIATINTYTNLPAFHKQVLRELGIIGYRGVSIIGADVQGLNRLLTAYGALDAGLRATTERIDETQIPGAGLSFNYNVTPGVPSSFFFTNGNIAPVNMVNVLFSSGGDLHVGATRFLKIDNSGLSANPAFTVGTNHDLYLHAADQIDLTGNSTTGTMFSNGIRSITMSAATINLTNINFPANSVASLNSTLGQTNFGTTKIQGKVNFNNVTYGGGSVLDSTNFTTATQGRIAIGTLENPAQMPTPPAR